MKSEMYWRKELLNLSETGSGAHLENTVAQGERVYFIHIPQPHGYCHLPPGGSIRIQAVLQLGEYCPQRHGADGVRRRVAPRMNPMLLRQARQKVVPSVRRDFPAGQGQDGVGSDLQRFLVVLVGVVDVRRELQRHLVVLFLQGFFTRCENLQIRNT
jgi:hypothetical protein